MVKGTAAGLVGAGAAVSAIGGAYKFGEFLNKAKRLKDVGPSNAVYVRLIKRIRADLDEVKRLLTVPEIKDALEANPPKAKWVYGAMRDVRGALENITPHTERVASDIEDGRRVGVRHRLYWLLSEKEKLENREKELHVAHASLTEVLAFLTALEPVELKEKESRHTKVDIDVDVRHGGPDRVEQKEVWVERHDRGPRHVHETHETVIEHERPSRHFERETWVERDRDPRYEERETYVERRDPRHEERYYEDRQYGPQPGRVEEREFHYQRDPRHIEAEYYERGPQRYDERRYEERRYDNYSRRPDSFEDRVPERETFMQSDVRRSYNRSPYGEYAEYGAPQPSGAAEYRRRFTGDPGFGDELVLNPQPVPPQGQEYERETWIEEKEDYTRDQYGNKLPEPLQRTRYPQYPKPRY
ncbi:uncharacterized protein EI97DRAFT_470330 [Westerdykella ornata]|uniref:Uncharacterized protein n=1 Tax=Westerdykella ornata TaxID=318751 RepID=A0A6A6JBB1_WESOR|nr:uncharacterized protein EI97DRAFT_470330 [Westerdykella ornata]KAF2272479.1 hypothetical protein EI97DRAFT_470330 [Westerdykella ornata]